MGKNNKKINGIAKSPRACAIHLLTLCNQGSYANELVPSYLARSGFNDKDKAQITHIVYSTLRRQIRIDFALQKIVGKSIADLDEIVLNALRVVSSQIDDENSSYGVVNDVVTAMPFRFKSYVNALARKISKLFESDRFFEDEPEDTKASMPSWICNEIKDVFRDPNSIIEALNASSAVTVANIERKTVEIVDSEKGRVVEFASLIKSRGSINAIEQFKNERLISIDQGSILVSQCVDSDLDMDVLDVCAAPGGKSLMMSTKAKKVFSIDLAISRARKILENINRLEVQNVYPIAADATNLPFSDRIFFDRILVDAPCSGLGVLRRRPDLRLRVKDADIDELVELQKLIITQSVKLLKPNAKLIFSVCTFTKKETIGIDEWIKTTFPDLLAEDLTYINSNLRPLGRGVILDPSKENDGMYALRLVGP